MTALSIFLLGALRVTVEGVPVTHFRSDKARAMLAYLAVQPDRDHRREALAGLLWPEYPEASARHSLSQTLFGLRSDLGRANDASRIQGDAKAVLFSSVGCTVDALEIESLAAGCRSHPHADAMACPECLERYARVAALYTGEFMQGFSLRDAPEFEEWLLLKREECRREAVSAVDVLSSHGELHGDAPDALRYAYRWLELEPLDERAHRQILRLLAASGRSSAALAHYEDCWRVLRGELGAEPDARTTALYERIRNGEFTPRAKGHGDLTVRPLPYMPQDERGQSPLFVAREDELGRLQTHLDKMLVGHAQFAFVTGEAGCGKTALVQEFARRAGREHPDLVVATGRCNAFTGIGDPYLAFRETLSQLGGQIEGALRAGSLGGEDASRLWRLTPDTCLALAEVGPDLVGALIDARELLTRAEAAAPPDAAWAGRIRDLVAARGSRPAAGIEQPALFQQITAVLQRLALAHPLLLVLEDLHWADAASLSLLFHLGAHLAADRILILGAYRPATAARVDATHQGLETIVHEIQRDYGDIIVNLDRADGQRFVSALVGAEPNTLDSAFLGALYRQAGGNALFTSELLQALRERGELVRDSAGRWSVGGALRWNRLPPRVEAVIAERVARLPTGLQEALRVASVEGETFTAEVVARVLKVDPLALVRGLSEAAGMRHNLIMAAGLGRAQSGPISSYRFRHILVQNYVYGTLDTVERAYLHRAVAEAIEATADEDGDDHVLALARHYEEAGDAEKAAAYLQRVGDRAMRLVAFAEAEELYARELELLASVPQDRGRDASEIALLLRLANARGFSAGFTDPLLADIGQRALSLAERLQDDLLSYRALSGLLNYHMDSAAYKAATADSDRMLALARSLDDEDLAAWVRNLCGQMHMYCGKFAAVVRDVEPILALWKAGGLDSLRARLNQRQLSVSKSLVLTVMALTPMGHYGRALGYLSEALELGRAAGRASISAM